jgi:ribosomal protein S18 acetylase RimI-like enzyme
MIKPLQKDHAARVAQLHINGIPTGFISSLGERFVTALYESISQSPYGFGLVEDVDGKIVGFIAFTTNLKGLYKSILKKDLFRFGFLLCGKLLSLRTVKKIFETLFYPNRIEAHKLPNAELLSVVVDESQRGRGIAAKLIQEGLAECRSRGIQKVKVLVADFNDSANRLYQKTGFEKITQIENHGIISNVYVVVNDHFAKSDQL